MRGKIIGVLLVGLVLIACQEKGTSTPMVPSSSEQVTSSEEASSAYSGSVQEISYNGQYYFVQGKYGEVIIVNKRYPLASDYAPGENPTAKSAFLQLLDAMREQGFAVFDQYSGYRSYETQAALYNSYVERDGQEAADRYSARPGYSEHQTGLAFDILDNTGQLLTEPTAAAWLVSNAPSYGFIVRYLEGQEASTGYMPESWHIRYIGEEAVDIASSGKTLEDYFGVQGGDYVD